MTYGDIILEEIQTLKLALDPQIVALATQLEDQFYMARDVSVRRWGEMERIDVSDFEPCEAIDQVRSIHYKMVNHFLD
jgi:hypothetical protein